MREAPRMYRYRFTGDAPVVLTTLHREVSPGEVIETEEEIRNPSFVAVEDRPKRATKED